MLYNIHEMRWDPWLFDLFDIPLSMAPEVRPSAGGFGLTSHPGVVEGVPILGVAGDQQAALFGQRCFEPGQAKNTYGTGCFLLMHTGGKACRSSHGLLSTLAASAPGAAGPEYALEGSVFTAGALVQWLRDELGLVATAAETEELAESVPDTGGVYVVPAFTGLGAPHWDAEARGAIYGLTRGTSRAQVVRAALEALAYQVHDLAVAMEADAGVPLRELKVGRRRVGERFSHAVPKRHLAHAACPSAEYGGNSAWRGVSRRVGGGFWKDTAQLLDLGGDATRFEPRMDGACRARLLDGWARAVGRTMEKGRSRAVGRVGGRGSKEGLS